VGKPAKAAASRTAAQRRVAARSRPARQPNRRQGTLLFPVMTITGISVLNDINDLRILITVVIPQTLHLVVGTLGAPRPAEAQPTPAGLGIHAKTPEFSGFGGWSKGPFPVPPMSRLLLQSLFHAISLSKMRWSSVTYFSFARS